MRTVADLRLLNQNNLVRLLATQGPMTRLELARRLNLSKMAVTNIVREMIQHEVIEVSSSDPPDRAGGPRPERLGIRAASIFAIGIEVNVDDMRCMVFELGRGPVMGNSRIVVAGESFCQLIVDAIADMLDTPLLRGKRVIGVGLALSGLVDRHQVYHDDRLAALRCIDPSFAETLEARFFIPVFIENNMNASAIAEWLFGDERQESNFVYLGIDKGVGAGIYGEYGLVRGRHGFAGELGHVSIGHEGRRCACGNVDCSELYLTTTALLADSGEKGWPMFVARARAEGEGD